MSPQCSDAHMLPKLCTPALITAPQQTLNGLWDTATARQQALNGLWIARLLCLSLSRNGL